MTETRILPLLTWRAAICESGLPPTTRHVALTLSLYMNERGGSAFPGAPRLAHDTGLHEDTVRRQLHDLVDAGWLRLVERGGIAGERKRANVYQAVVPTPDPESGVPLSPTPDRDASTPDRQSATPRTGSGQLFSNSASNSGATDLSVGPDSIVQVLVAQYVEDYAKERPGHRPQGPWCAAAGRAVKAALANGETEKDIAGCLYVIAHEGKHPNTLAHVLADSHAGRERRLP